MSKFTLVFAALLGSSMAFAIPVTVAAGGSFVATFDGRPTLDTSPPTIGPAVPYLSSVVYFSDFTFVNVGAQTRVDFEMNVYNTSEAPLTASSLSVIGFNTTPNLAPGIHTVSGAFNTIYRNDTLPGAGAVEFCASNVLNCAGVGGSGVAQGTGGTAYASLFFGGAGISSITFDNAFVRYQNLVGVPGVFNGLGTPVPEPAAYAVLVLGLMLSVVVVVRRRRTLAQA